MKSLSKKLVIFGIIFSFFATILCFGIFLQPKTEVFAYTPGSSATLRGVVDDWWTMRNTHEDGQFHEDSLIKSITVTNRNYDNFLNDYDESNGDYRFDVSEDEDGSLYCYVINRHDNVENVDYQDVYIYADVETIYAPEDSTYLFACWCESGGDHNAYSNGSELTISTITFDCFDTSNVYSFEGFFQSEDSSGNIRLTIIGLNKFDTSNATNMSGMFSNAGIRNVDVSSFNTSKVTKMNNMFEVCRNLEELDLSNFDTSLVTNITRIFAGCHSMTSLDMSSWDLSKVTDASQVFSDCNDLTTIYTPQVCSTAAANITLPATFQSESSSSTTLGSFPPSTDSTKMAIYDIDYTGERTYEQPRTAETGVFVDVILPAIFVLIVGTLVVMYIGQGKKKNKFIIG